MKIPLDEHVPYALPRSFPEGWDIGSTIEPQSSNLVEYAHDDWHGHFMRPLNILWIATAYAERSRVSRALRFALNGTQESASRRLHEAKDGQSR